MREPESGKIIDDRYEIRDLIGSGGMARVFEAFDRLRQELIALKTIAPEWLDDEDMYNRFVDEAILTSRLSHPNIVNVRDIAHGEWGVFITMERLKGRTLRKEMDDRLQIGKSFTLPEVRSIISQLCDALSYAHLFTVHRDLKPENIWLEEGGRLKLMDFGLASVRGGQSRAVSARTRTGVSFGTPYYIAPEQLSSLSGVTSAADQYSVAAVAHELLTGELPAGMPQPIESRRSDLSRRSGRSIRRALARDPKRRFPSIETFKTAFCDHRKLLSILSDSPRMFAAMVVAVFLSGVLFVSVVEQVNALRSQKILDQVYWRKAALESWLALSNHWEQLTIRAADLNERVESSDSSLVESDTIGTLHSRLVQAQQIIDAGRLAEASEILDTVNSQVEQPVERTFLQASNRLHSARVAWEHVLNPNTPLLMPDLKHIADPESLTKQALDSARSGELLAATAYFNEATEILTQWTDELETLNQRTEFFLDQLPQRPLLHTNSIGMVFARIPKTDKPRQHLWVSIWETRVIDFARFATDGLNWLSRFETDDRWRAASKSGGLTMPVTQISQSGAFNFVRWLGMYDSSNNPIRIDVGPNRVTPALLSDYHYQTVLDRIAEFDPDGDQVEDQYPIGLYAFSQEWPPFRNRPRFTGDNTLRAEHFIRPVALTMPNVLGLFDCDGNVWERFGRSRYHLGSRHWLDTAESSIVLAGGGGFGTVSLSDNSSASWPVTLNEKKIGRIEAIGFRLMLYLSSG